MLSHCQFRTRKKKYLSLISFFTTYNTVSINLSVRKLAMLTACEGFAFHTVLSSDSLHSVIYIKITQIHLTFTWYTAMKHSHNATKLLKHTTFTLITLFCNSVSSNCNLFYNFLKRSSHM